MVLHWPKHTYALALIVPAVALTMWVSEHVISSTENWQRLMASIPITTMWMLTGAFFVGLLVQDSYNRQSWLRENWRYLTRRFDVAASYVARHVYTNEPQRRLDTKVHIQFTRRVRNGRLMLRVLSYAGKNEPPRETPFDLDKNLNKERGDVMTICIYRLPLPYPHWEHWTAGWAPDVANPGRNHPPPDGVVAVLELENGWWPRQRHRFYVRTVDFRDGKPSEAMYCLDEDWEIFDVTKRLSY